jgi:hypothetical protein
VAQLHIAHNTGLLADWSLTDLHRRRSVYKSKLTRRRRRGQVVVQAVKPAYRRMSLAASQGPVPGQPQFAILGSINGEYR